MNSTGIVRKIDELGRIVIPKELRKTLKISIGSAMEIFIDDNRVVLQKHSPLATLEQLAQDCLDTVFIKTNMPCLISDHEGIICVKGMSKKYLGSKLVLSSPQHNTQMIIDNPLCEELNADKMLLLPIEYQSTMFGYLAVFGPKNGLESLSCSIELLIDFFAKQLEQ